MKSNKEFKDILMDFLHENKLTQTQFACKIGLKQSQVSEWIKEKAKPGYDTLKRISLTFGISADYLLGIKDYY